MKKYHFIGIGGIGMSALCRIALQRGDSVQGSDKVFSSYTRQLESEGAKIFLGQKAENIERGLDVIYSSDIKSDNPEFRRAKELGLTMLHRSELLEEFSRPYKQLFVAGTHGKTTTTSLLSSVFQQAGKDPSFVIGGMLRSLQSNARKGEGEFFILEADESDGSFLKGNPYAAIVTNLEKEHLDYWKTVDRLKESFKQFFQKIQKPELLFWCYDDPLLRALSPPGTSYGFSPEADLQITRYQQDEFYLSFDICWGEKHYLDYQLRLIGKHNIQNALAVFGLSLKLGVPEKAIKEAFLNFSGVSRRMEFLGRMKDVDFFDDYAHHPTEIAVTLQGLKKAASSRRLVAIFQPHRYTRVRDLASEFSSSFESADFVIMTDIYSSNEAPIEGIDERMLFEKIKKIKPAIFIPKEELAQMLFQYLDKDDVVITLGAGDITYLGRKLLDS